MIQKWWKTGEKHTVTTSIMSFSEDKWQYHFTPLMLNGVKVRISDESKPIQSLIVITALEADSSYVEWKAEWPTTSNPFVRLQQYCQAREVKKNMQNILQQFSAFMNSPQKLYGLEIERSKVTDTLIATSKKVFNSYPTPEQYYTLLEDLEEYVQTSGAQVTNYPMLNISKIDSSKFGVMVGLPVNKPIPETNQFQLKRMIPGNILVAEVTGGVQRIEAAMQEMQNYIQENGLLPPAIPYQSLVTNRKAEIDTSRWVTKLYFPVY